MFTIEMLRRVSAGAILSLFVAACGGGGGGSSTPQQPAPPPPPPPPVDGGGNTGGDGETGGGETGGEDGGPTEPPEEEPGEGGGTDDGEGGSEGGNGGTSGEPGEGEEEPGNGDDEDGEEEPGGGDDGTEEEEPPEEEPVNQPPELTSPVSFTFDENTFVGIRLSVVDPEGDEVLVTFPDEADNLWFDFDERTLTIQAATPDHSFNYEQPVDMDGDNVYNLVVVLSDGEFFVRRAITITIADADDMPTCSYDGSAFFSENATGLVYTFDGADEDGPGVYGDLLITADPIHLGLPEAIYESARLDSATGSLFFDLPIDYEDAHFSADRIVFTTQYRQNGQIAACRVFVTLENVPGTVISGLKLSGPMSQPASVGDIDGDGLEELWLEGRRSFDVIQSSVEARLIFGETLSQSIEDDGRASLDVTTLDGGNGIRFFTTDVDPVGASNNGGEQLIGRAIGDLDGDGFPELLIGHRTNVRHERGEAQAMPPAAYLVWGDAILRNSSGEFDLRNMAASDGIVIRLPSHISRFELDVASGDFDGDGLPDVVIGAPEPAYLDYEYRPHTFVVFSSTLLQARATGQLDLEGRNDVVVFSDESPGMRRAGAHVVSIGDIDNDGFDDLLVASQVDQFAIISGEVISSSPRDVVTPFWGSAVFLETPLLSGGNYVNRQPTDLDGDGVADVLLAHGDSQGNQVISIVKGSLIQGRLSSLAGGAITLSASSPGTVSISNLSGPDIYVGDVMGVGDIDGDGFEDFAFGKIQYRYQSSPINSIFVVSGRALEALDGQVFDLTTPLPSLVIEIRFTEGSDSAFSAFTSLSDIDGDGRHEIVAVERWPENAYVILSKDIANAMAAGTEMLSIADLFEFEPPVTH